MARLLLAALLSLWSTAASSASCTDSSTLFQIRPQDTLLKNATGRTGPGDVMWKHISADRGPEQRQKSNFCRCLQYQFHVFFVIAPICHHFCQDFLKLHRPNRRITLGYWRMVLLGCCWNFVSYSPLVTQWFTGSNLFKPCCSFMLVSHATLQPEKGSNLTLMMA